MPRYTAVASALSVLVLAGCAEHLPTPPAIAASSASAALQRSADAGLTLHPSGFGEESYAAWKAKEGKTDDHGNADHALYFQKMVPTATVAAGIAVIDGVSGLPASAIAGLSWEHRTDGHCGAGAPRWNLGLEAPDGTRFTVFLGCAAAAKGPITTDDQGRTWIRDTYPGLGVGGIAAQIEAATGLPVADLTVRSLLIVFDEGNDVGPGFVYLDNITVTIGTETTVFTGPMDNGDGDGR